MARIVDHVRLGLIIDVIMCLPELAFFQKKKKEPHESVMNPKRFIVPLERGRDSKGLLEMASRLLSPSCNHTFHRDFDEIDRSGILGLALSKILSAWTIKKAVRNGFGPCSVGSDPLKPCE